MSEVPFAAKHLNPAVSLVPGDCVVASGSDTGTYGSDSVGRSSSEHVQTILTLATGSFVLSVTFLTISPQSHSTQIT